MVHPTLPFFARPPPPADYISFSSQSEVAKNTLAEHTLNGWMGQYGKQDAITSEHVRAECRVILGAKVERTM